MTYLETIFKSGRRFRPNFHVESLLRSVIQESHILHRSELSRDHFHEWATFSSIFSCREFLEIYYTREPHQSQKWPIWRPFSWVGDDFVQIFMSRDSWDLLYKRATSFIEVSYLETIFITGRRFRPNFHVEFLEIYNSREPHSSQKWAIWRAFSGVGDDFVQIFMSRDSWDLLYKRATSFREVSYLETLFMSGRRFRPGFHVESFLRSIVQKNDINHRSDLSGDHFHEWATISSKFSCREFLDIYNTREPHQSQKWPIWRPFSWVGDDFVQIFMSRDSWDLLYKRATSFIEVSYLETIFITGRRFRPNFHVEFLEIYNSREPHSSQKWAIWRAFSGVGDDFVQIFMSRDSWDLLYKRATSFTEVSYLETLFMSGRRFRPGFHVESFLRSIVQKNDINHRSDLSGDHFHEWATISSKFSCREFLDIYNTREPHQSQKWPIWRPFSWVGDDFVQIFMSRVSWDL